MGLLDSRHVALLAVVLGALALGCPKSPGASSRRGGVEVWGTTLRWHTVDPATARLLEQQLPLLLDELSLAFDPDCIWRDASDGCVNPAAKRTEVLEGIAKQLSAETLGFFDIHRDLDGAAKRDFAGLARGYVLTEMVRVQGAGWVGDFGGDVYLSPGFALEDALTIADPETQDVPFARVHMSGGWMLASSSRELGATVWNPHPSGDASDEWKEDFQRVVLFAHPDFEGTRLDAWSTALIPGGQALLDHLWGLEVYRDQWAWLVFDHLGDPHCSPNLECDFGADPGVVRVPW